MSFEAAALDAVVEESRRYPYFVQLWGEALCRALPEGARKINASWVETAQRDYYEDRYRELENRGLLSAAEAIARLYAARGGEARLYDKTLKAALQGDGRTGSEAAAFETMRKLESLGFIWQPPGHVRYEAGIPSLMTHVLAPREDPAPGMPQKNAPGP